jgi:hypothetical protein
MKAMMKMTTMMMNYDDDKLCNLIQDQTSSNSAIHDTNLVFYDFSTFLDLRFDGKVKSISKMHQFIFTKESIGFVSSKLYSDDEESSKFKIFKEAYRSKERIETMRDQLIFPKDLPFGDVIPDARLLQLDKIKRKIIPSVNARKRFAPHLWEEFEDLKGRKRALALESARKKLRSDQSEDEARIPPATEAKISAIWSNTAMIGVDDDDDAED